MKLFSSLAFILISFRVTVMHGFSPIRWKVEELKTHHQPFSTLLSDTKMDRSSFLDKATSLFIGTTIPSTTVAVAIISSLPIPTNAIEFVPASPFFSGTYQDAVEIMYAQRIAVDNIANVIQDGKMEEAGFKVMQLNAQTRAAGKIILDSYQQQLSGKNNNNLMLLRFLSCQKKFAVLLDSCDECGEALQNTLKGKLGATAAAQIKSSKIVDETKSAYDDFLLDVKTMEKELDLLREM